MSKTMDNGADKTYKSPSQLYHKILCLKQVIEHRDNEIERLTKQVENLILNRDYLRDEVDYCIPEIDTLKQRVKELEADRAFIQKELYTANDERDSLHTRLATEQANHEATAEQNSYLSVQVGELREKLKASEARAEEFQKAWFQLKFEQESQPKQPTIDDVYKTLKATGKSFTLTIHETVGEKK